MAPQYGLDPAASPCPDCGSCNQRIDSKEAELVCCHCGLVLQDHMLDYAPEHRNFADDSSVKQDRSRTGFASQRLGCNIEDSSGLGRRLAGMSRKVFEAPVSVAGGDVTEAPVTRGNEAIKREFEDYVRGLGIGEDCLLVANQLFDDYTRARKTAGLNRKAAYVACVYYATKASASRRTMKEIAAHFDRILDEGQSKSKNTIEKRMARTVNLVHDVLRQIPRWKDMFVVSDAVDHVPKATGRAISGREVVKHMVAACTASIPASRRAAIDLQCLSIWDRLAEVNDPLMTMNGQAVNIAVIVRACELQGLPVQSSSIIAQCKQGYTVKAASYKSYYEALRKVDCKRTQHYADALLQAKRAKVSMP
jgi:hypothetical protein